MPLAFARFPVNALTNPSGLLGTDGQIYVITSGESSALHTLTPELTTSLEAKGGGRGARGIRWAAIIWLLGRVVTYSPEFARLIIESTIIGSTKLGEITDLLLTRARESNMLSSPLRTGQLRVFLRKLANMQASPIFRLDAADAIDVATIYPPVAPAPATQPAQGPPSGGPRPPTGPPPPAAVTAMSIMAYGDIAPEALGAFELTVGPRLSGVDRSAQGGYQVVVTMVLQSALQAIVPLGVRGTFDLPTWIDARAQVEEFRRAFKGAQPPEQLEVLHAGLVDARRRLAAGLASSQHDALTVENILLAVDHYEALIPILGQDSAGGRFCAVAPSAAWTEIRTLCARTGIRASEPVVGDLAILAAKLSFLTPRFAGADMQQLSPAERTAKVLDILEDKEQDRQRAKEGVPSGEARLVGYSTAHQAEVYKRLGDPAFTALNKALQGMFDSHEHAHAIIGAIIRSGEAIFMHALCGQKDAVPVIPLVKMIANTLRMHGPTFMGQLAFELCMPAHVVAIADPLRKYPPLKKLWEVFCTGSVSFDLENDLYYAALAFYHNPDAVHEQVHVPADQVYGSVTRNQLLLTRVARDNTGFFALLNFSGQDSFERVLQAAIAYHNEAGLVNIKVRNQVMQAYITGVLAEHSVIRMRDLKSGDPSMQFGGNLVVPLSKAEETFESDRAGVAEAAGTATHLMRLGLGHLLPKTYLVPVDLAESSASPRSTAVARGHEGATGAFLAESGTIAPPTTEEETPLTTEEKAIKKSAVGSRSGGCYVDKKKGAEGLLVFRMKDNQKQAIPLKEFRETEGVPAGACAPCFCSVSVVPHAFCLEPKHPQHVTATKGAHNFSLGAAFRKKHLQALILLGAAQLAATTPILIANARVVNLTEPLLSGGATSWLHIDGVATPISTLARCDAPPVLPLPIGAMPAEPPPMPQVYARPSPPPAAALPSVAVRLSALAAPWPGPAPDSATKSSESRILRVDTLENTAVISCLNHVRDPSMVTVKDEGSRLGVGAQPSSIALQGSTTKTASWADKPPGLDPTQVPTVQLTASAKAASAHVFVPLIFDGTAPRIGLPLDECGEAYFGKRRSFISRETDYADAARWAAALFPGRTDVHAFYYFEIETLGLVVSGALITDPPPMDWEMTARDVTDEWTRTPLTQAQSSNNIAWATLAALHGDATVARVAALALARACAFRQPTAALPDGVRVGAQPELALEPQQVLVEARAHPVPWDTVVEKAQASMRALRHEYERRIADTTRSPVDRAECAGWLAVCKPLQLNAINATLRSQCYSASDTRLHRVPFPYVPSVASSPLPPLPPPPPSGCVPSDALDWDTVLLPGAYAAALECQQATWRWLLHAAKTGRAQGCPKPKLFACNLDENSCYPWAAALIAAGHVLCHDGERIALADLSRAPNFSLDPTYAANLLKGSPDAALRDACTTHGVEFFTQLGGQLVMIPPMSSIADGFASVHETLREMIDAGWFAARSAASLAQGRLNLLTAPGRFSCVGCVVKSNLTSWRMVNNDTAPPAGAMTTFGTAAPVLSLNASIGSQLDRALRARELASAGDVRRDPARFSVQAISARPPYRPFGPTPGSGFGAPILPPELKPFFFMLTLAIVVLTPPAEMLGLDVLSFGDDFAKFFHQLAVSFRQRIYMQLMLLDPSAITQELITRLIACLLADTPDVALTLIQAGCVSMGTVPSSRYAQGYVTEYCNKFQDDFHRDHLATYDKWAADCPAFAGWLAVRAQVAAELEVGAHVQGYLLIAFGYTDDPRIFTIGPVLLCDATEHWGRECTAANLRRSDPCKRCVGVQGEWVGGQYLATALLSYLSPAKVLKALTALRGAQAGTLTVREMRELGGLLHHFVFTLVLPKQLMYNFYDGIDTLHRIRTAAEAVGAPVRAPMGRTRALFLFGGRAQHGTLDLLALGETLGFTVVNYDIANGDQFDLRRREVQHQLLGEIEARVYAIVFAAPPSRTYSSHHIPRLRSPAEPGGITPIPRAFARSVRDETALAHFALTAIAAAADAHVIYGLEHLSATHPEQGSIWHHPATAAIAARPTSDGLDTAPRADGNCTHILGHRVWLAGLRPLLSAVSDPFLHQQALLEQGALAVRAMAAQGDRLVERRGGAKLDDGLRVPLTRRSSRAFVAWTGALESRTGSSMLGSVFHSRPPTGQVMHRIHSDAALKGTGCPGITTNLYGYYATLPLLGTRYAQWPIVALEFAGQGPFGLITFAADLAGAVGIAIPGDSLVVPTILASAVRESRLMRFMHDEMLELLEVKAVLNRCYCSHEYGVGNPICDMGSRGRDDELREVMRHLRLAPVQRDVPAAFLAYMERVADFFDALSTEQRELEMLALHKSARPPPAAAIAHPAAQVVPPPSPPRTARKASPPPLAPVGARTRPRIAHAPARVARVARGVMAALLTGAAVASSRVLTDTELCVGATFSSTVAGDGARTKPPPFLTGRPPNPQPSLGPPPLTPPAPAQTALRVVSAPLRTTAGAPPPLTRPPGRLTRQLSLAPALRPGGGSLPGAWQHRWPAPVTATTPAARAPTTWEAALLQDGSPMALLPGREEELAGLLDVMREHLESAFADSTNEKDKYHLEAWRKACAALGTPMWRTDVAANTGLDPVGHRRELILPALALLHMYARMQPRSKKDPAANPRNALNKLYAVAREHKKRGYKMAPFTIAVQVVTGMLRQYVELHGTDSLAPSRKNPLTNVLILAMLRAPWDWTSYSLIAFRATVETLAETGMRKGDVSKAHKTTAFKKGRLTFASLKWRVGGNITALPALAEILSITEGDGCWLVFGSLKNDAFGEFFGSKPSWLPFSSVAARNACRSLAALTAAALRAGLTAATAPLTPLFGPTLGVEWHHDLLDRLFVKALREGAGLTEAECACFSVHSFRIYLACALYAAGCPPERIMAILRWKSEEALLIYARMNDIERTAWIISSMDQLVDSTTAANLPRLDADEWVAHLQTSIAAGALGKAARDADRDIELEP